MLKKVLLIILILSNFLLFAKDKKTFGIGLSYISAPVYLSSKKQNSHIYPIPYIEYKSKYFNIDRDRIYKDFLSSDKANMELSIRGMLPSKNEDTLREGMNDLDAILEIGPKFIYNIYSKKNMKINLEVPIRIALSLGKDLLKYKGYYSSLQIKYENSLLKNYKVNFILGASYSDKKLNNYYYEVKKEFINSNRKEYHSNSGFSGLHNSFSITKKDKNFWYGAFVKYYYLKNAVFENSPLYQTDNSLIYGFAFSYLF